MKSYKDREADASRRTYLITFPRDVDSASVLNFIRALGGLPKPQMFKATHTIAFETYADVRGIKHYLSIPPHVIANVESLLRTHIVGSALSPAEVPDVGWDEAIELGMNNAHVPLRIGSPEAVTATILSSFSPLQSDQAVMMQWIVTPTRPRQIPDRGEDKGRLKAKVDDVMFLAVGRIAGKGKDASSLVRRLYMGLASTHSQGVHFTKRAVLRGALLKRIANRSGVIAYPCSFNASELTAIVGFPVGSPNVAGLPQGRARHLAPDTMIRRGGIVLGKSNFPSLERDVAVQPESLMMHQWVLGATGTGKSTLLHNQATQIMQQGHGLILIEPKGDLARHVLSSVPRNRVGDVIWFDMTDTAMPIGLNVLRGREPERTAGFVVGLIKALYGDSWGPRLEQILRYSVLTAAQAGLTLYDVKQLLVNPDFRGRVVRTIRDPDTRQFWRRLDSSPDNSIDSVVNKLDAFVGFRALRNVIGQVNGLDIAKVVSGRKILLVPLSSALMGEVNASLMGSLLVNMIWQEVRARSTRPPLYLMLDEFQNFLNLSVSMEDAFAEARSYNLSMMVANQHTKQLKPHIVSAVKNNARTKVVFGISHDDGSNLKDELAPLTATDLQNLGQYEAAAQIMTTDGLAPVTTIRTFAPPRPTGAGNSAKEASRAVYGRPVGDVEAELAERHKEAEAPPRAKIGRQS